jgi:hypothetical protein
MGMGAGELRREVTGPEREVVGVSRELPDVTLEIGDERLAQAQGMSAAASIMAPSSSTARATAASTSGTKTRIIARTTGGSVGRRAASFSTAASPGDDVVVEEKLGVTNLPSDTVMRMASRAPRTAVSHVIATSGRGGARRGRPMG